MENQISDSVHRLSDLDDNFNKNILKNHSNQKKQQLQSVSLKKLFRFATTFDVILMTIGSIAAVLVGAGTPAYALMWGKMAQYYSHNNQTLVTDSRNIMFIFFGVAIAVLLCGWIMYSFWMITGKRQANACKKAYLKALLNQQIGWFDTVNQSELTSNFSTDCQAFEGAIGEKNGYVITIIGMFLIGLGISLSKGWLMTLVIVCAVPVICLTGFIFMWGLGQKQINTQKQYNYSSGLAQQALTSIKTVKMLNGQKFESLRYRQNLQKMQKKCLKYIIIASIGYGLLTGVIFFSYSYGFWYGSHCIQGTNVCKSNQFYNIQNVIVIFFCILIVALNFSQLTPALKKITEGRIAAARIFRIIDRQPLIKNVQNGLKPKNVKGEIRFHNVSFSYPKQPNKKILNNISFTIDKLSNAFVGESGCGKSTIFQLLLRFYDPDEGKITLDGVDIRQLDLNWLRQNIGYVGQQPVLFATSIRQNLIFGKEDVTDEEIQEALKQAEAYDFVQSLSQKLDTFVGNGGGQLSGGQKQRIAIARALLRNPKVLLLDEATSALDRKNERLIQKTLQNISKERVTISIAHRIKTIQKCQMIYVLQKGSISEKGSFNSLKKFKSHNKQISTLKTLKEATTTLKLKFFNKNNNPQQQKMIDEEFQDEDQQNVQMQQRDQKNIKLKEQTIQIKPQQQQQQKNTQSVFLRIFLFNKNFFIKFVLILLLAVLNGLTFPIFALFLAKVTVVLMNYSQNNKQQYRQDANYYCLLLLIIGLISFVINFIKNFFFYRVGEKITNNIRCSVYQKMLKMPIQWFDNPNNNCGKLVGKLSTDCKSIDGLTTTFVGLFVQSISILIGSVVIAMIFQWRTTLATIGLVPFIAIVGLMEMKQFSSVSNQLDQLQKQSLNLILESVTNIRTVLSLGYQNNICKKQQAQLQEPYRLYFSKAIQSGFFYGLSQSMVVFILSIMFCVGTVFVKNYGASIQNSFVAIYQLIYGAYWIGANIVFLPDVGKTKSAAKSLFKIIDLEDEDQIQIKQQSKLLNRGIEGNIQLKNISFKYKNRNEQLFTDFNLKINKGTKVAFVGHSGCGKSTIIQMLLRFYDPSSGQILIDGNDIKDYDIHYLRKQLGVVSQQPVLFNQSFRYNIIYNENDVTEQRMITATKQANAYEVIKNNRSTEESLSNEKGKQKSQEEKKKVDDFDRNVGIKGSHISGGQKQRIAIARTILRNPCVLLLDEATSALDNENEKKVQESLDSIMKGKTTISIAHRTQTIKNSDKIYVFDKGKIIEQGNYNQLISKQNHFYQLQKDVKAQ